MMVLQAAAGYGRLAEPAQVPPYVGAATGPDGRPYFKVLDEHAHAIAGALNSYLVVSDSPVYRERVLIGERLPAGQVGDMAAQIAQVRGERGVALIGDPTADQRVTVIITTRLPTASNEYALIEPDAGWQPTTDADWLPVKHELKRAGAGLKLGALIGGAAAITIIGLHALRKRR